MAERIVATSDMEKRNLLLGAAAGIVFGYAAVRAVQSARAISAPPAARKPDAATYGATRRALTVASIARSLCASASLAYGPAGARLERVVRALPVPLQAAAFVAGGAAIDALLEFPADLFEGYDLERRYGLSEQPLPSWLSDYAKQQALSSAVAAVLSAALAAALRKWPRTWPYVAGAAALPLLVAANVAIPIYVLPLFNTYEPIAGELETRLRALASRFGVGDAEILRVDMSKQTKKANAFVIGIGRTHRIVVGDTLIDHFTPAEIEFVVAHELGHYVAKDTWRFIAVAHAGVMLFLFAASRALRTPERTQSPRAIAQVQFLMLALSQTLQPALAAFSRSREWAADRFALDTTKDAQSGASAFRRLRDQNLAEDEQPAWYEFFFGTHPSLKARIAALDAARYVTAPPETDAYRAIPQDPSCA